MVSIALDITFFIQMGLFLLLMYLLNVLVYKPVLKVMAERDERLTGGEQDVMAIEEKIEEKLAEYKEKIDAAKVEGNAGRAALKKEGLDKESQIVGEAQAAAQESLESACRQIEKEKDRALKDIGAMIDEMGREIAVKTVGRSL